MFQLSDDTKLASGWCKLCFYLLAVVTLLEVNADVTCGGLVSREPSAIPGCGPITVVRIPSDGSGRYNMVLNASMPIYSNENMDVQLENEDEVKRGTASYLKYTVSHPECNKEILVTNLLFNNRVLCRNAPHTLSPQQPVTKLYHQSTHHGQRNNNVNQDAPSNTLNGSGNKVWLNIGDIENFQQNAQIPPGYQFAFGGLQNNLIPSSGVTSQGFIGEGFGSNPFLATFSTPTRPASPTSPTQPTRPTLPFQTSQLTPSQQAQVNRWQEVFNNGNFFNANPFLNAFNGQPGLPDNNVNLGNPGTNVNVDNRAPQPTPDDTDINSICGHSTVALIQGGTNAQPGEFPWLGGLFIRSGNTYLCTVNLVSQRHAITAAHCFTNPESAEIYGILWGHPSRGVDKYYMRLRTIRLHPAYNSTRLLHDVAIAFLADTVTFSISLKPICMWQIGREGGLMGVNGMVAGFGPDYTELKKIDFPIVSQETCRASNVIFHFQTSDYTFCAGRRKSDEGPCKGDSGAGYMQWVEDRFFLRGLVSSSLNANGNCNLKEYIIFADLSKEIQWLQRTIT